ncbi:hypothetical protein DM860_016281 [Cuscuta australis]|uniref:BHLH domain-containing protein n=1 Tax=Cuscuta australis TaxID=267555 RepID=A0A328E6H1_9ASTE|nr:hypothetical protein DM860_016281 [Cuscuta australis]
MQRFQSFYEVGNCSGSYNFVQGKMWLNNNNGGGRGRRMDGGDENDESACAVGPATAAAEAKANKSHSEAERRRRKRINGHLATLRTLLPTTIKTDKASLLTEAVRCVRELKKATAELAAAISPETTADSVETPASFTTFPSEADELKLSYTGDDDDTRAGNVRAAICCEDRPEIMPELARALKSVEGTVVRAEMSTVGGRIKIALWLRVEGLGKGGDEAALAAVKLALKEVVDRPAAAVGSGNHLPGGPGNKRPRLLM